MLASFAFSAVVTRTTPQIMSNREDGDGNGLPIPMDATWQR